MTKNKGVTLVEVSLVIAVMAIVFGVIIAYLQQSQKLSQRAMHSQEISSNKINALSIIFQDLRATTRTSLGSWALNGDFEKGETSTKALYWSPAVNAGGVGTYEFIDSDSTTTVHNGFHSLSLQGDGNPLSYDSERYINLRSGMAYMVTVWMRSSNPTTTGKVALVNSLGAEVGASALDSPPDWKFLQFRYPSSGSYANNMVYNNQVKVRLVLQGGTGTAYYDDIACSTIHAVLVSTNSAEVNVKQIVSSPTDISDGAGYQFVRFENNIPYLYRYRISASNGINLLLREKFDSGSWMSAIPTNLALGLSTFKITYDENGLVPAAGKDSPVQIVFALSDTYTQNQKLIPREESVTILPLTQ